MDTEGRPSVSVVVPTRNRADLLPRALRSVLDQTYRDFELVVIDDGSTDATASVRRSVADPRLVWLEGPHAGVSSARNLGVRHARADWIAFLDDDNVWLPRYLERQVATGNQSGAEVVYCLGADVGADGSRLDQRRPPSADPLRSYSDGWSPFTSCILVRRDTFLRAGGFPVHLSHGEDQFLWTRLALDCRWAHTPEILMLRPEHGGPRLTHDEAADRVARAELDRAYGAAVGRRLGLRVSMRWFWEYPGRREFWAMIADARTRGRRAAWDSVRKLAPALPRSASTIWRPVVVLVVGVEGYFRVLDQYHRLHRTLIDRRRA
ncbi:MAG: glycosyltransferase family A protein [Acidimicrobiia bacterium]